jgi:uncharacterized protein
VKKIVQRGFIGAVLVANALVFASSCGSGSDGVEPGPRRQMLSSLATSVITPTYEQLVVDADALLGAARELETAPSPAALAAAQQAWRVARSTWKQGQAFAIGPAETLRTASKIDFSPIRTDRIEQEVAGDADLDASYIEDLGANVKGFLALEYLLFDPDGGDAAVLGALAVERRRQYARALAENLRDQAVLLRDAWEPDGGDFSGELAMAGVGSGAFPSIKSAVDALVNQLIFTSDDIGNQLLAALGNDGGSARPDAIDARRSGSGLADLIDRVSGIQNAYLGTYAGYSGYGFSRVVAEIDPHADGAIGLTIRRLLEALMRIPEPLEQSIVDERPAVENAQGRAADLVRSLEIDLVSALGTTVRFNPSDGD